MLRCSKRGNLAPNMFKGAQRYTQPISSSLISLIVLLLNKPLQLSQSSLQNGNTRNDRSHQRLLPLRLNHLHDLRSTSNNTPLPLHQLQEIIWLFFHGQWILSRTRIPTLPYNKTTHLPLSIATQHHQCHYKPEKIRGHQFRIRRYR